TYIVVRFQLVDITPKTVASQILKTMQGHLFVVDLEEEIRLINNAACTMLGHPESELLNRKISTILDIPAELRDYKKLLQYPVNNFELSFVDRQENQVYLSLSASVLTTDNNLPNGIVYVALDITQHKALETALARAKTEAETLVAERTAELSGTVTNLRNEIQERTRMERALKKAAEEWRITFDSTKDIIILLNSRFEVIKANRTAIEVLELSFPDIIGNPLIGSDGQCSFLDRTDLFDALERSKHRTERELLIEEKGISLVVTADPVFDHEGEFAGAVLTARDVSDVKKAEKERRISEQRYRALFDNANDGIAVVDSNGIIINANQKFGELHGFESRALIGTNLRLLETETYKDKGMTWMDRVLQGETLVFETEHYRKDGTRILLEISSKAIDIGGQLHIQSFHRDITEKKRLQEQLFQSQKMESIGVLAGGIAHDFNNILSAILGHAELLHESSNLDEIGKRRARIIETSARRAGAMISKLLSFAREGSFEIVPISLNTIARDTVELLERTMVKRNIAVKVSYDEGIPPVSGDSNHIEQVIMNLMVNAADAMPEGGTITVTTSFRDLQKGAMHIHPLLSPGKYVSLKVSDTGVGIPEAIRSNIFDPFFTTKKHGKGTGLGLAMVYGIVKEHRGAINLESQVGKGTTFEIYLPVSTRELPRIAKPQPAMNRRGTILVVDDDGDVLAFMKDTLESQGYHVIATDNAIYAQETFQKIAEEISFVITDIVMPLISGWELTKQFKIVKPAVKIIAVSGRDIWNIARGDRGVDAYITKPFTGLYLLTVVRKVIDSAGSASPLL
ncbi:MAG TPA: PAS domain S-box protein, partial [Thermodesulfovibrionales bacterium]|nr:PAS domain S-box protein [Thermodesulfovibrionales bacterium]